MTTGRINQVTIVRQGLADRPCFRAEEIFSYRSSGPLQERAPRQEQRARRGPRERRSWHPLTPSKFPRALSAGHGQAGLLRCRCRLGAPRGDLRPEGSAIQRPPAGGYLLLLVFSRFGDPPVTHRAHPAAPKVGLPAP